MVVCTFWESLHPSTAYWDEIDDCLNFTCDLYVHLAVSTSLQGVFHMLHFSVFCAIPASLTLSELTGTSGQALLLLFILYPAKHHLSWSYYPLYHQKIIAFLCNILSAEKKSVWPSEKLSGRRDIKYVQMQENKNIWDHPSLLPASGIILF